MSRRVLASESPKLRHAQRQPTLFFLVSWVPRFKNDESGNQEKQEQRTGRENFSVSSSLCRESSKLAPGASFKG
jgi:hypothetical protein